MTQQMDQSGKMSYVINMSQSQMYALQTLNTLGGPTMAYEQGGIKQKNLTEISNDRMVDKIQDALEKGKYRKAEKLSEKFSDRMEAQRRTMQNINAWTQNGANERNWSSYNYNVARWALGMAKGNAYAGKTVDVIPYAPLFTNICQSVNTIIDRGHVTMDVVGLGPVICQCPERYNGMVNENMNGLGKLYGQTPETVKACNTPWLFGTAKDMVSDLLKKTNMTDAQAEKSAGVITTVGAWFLLFSLARYIWKGGRSKDDKGNVIYDEKAGGGLFGRLAMVVWWAVWGNMALQMLTGDWLTDNLKKIHEKGRSARWEEKTNWMDKNSAEYKWAEMQMFNNCFHNVPYSVIACGCEKWPDGYPKIKNIDDMIAQLYVLLGTTNDPDRKAQIEGQIAFLKDLKKDPSKKDVLNSAFTTMGLKYEELANPSNAAKTANEKIATTVKEKEEQAKKDAEAKAAKDKEAKEKKEKERTVDTSDPNVTDLNSKWGTKTTEKIDTESKDPNAKLDRALHNIDLPLAQELQEARRNLMEGKAIEAHYKLVNGKLAVESYGMYTPLQYKDGKWFIGGFSDRRDKVSNYSQWFDNAAQAVWVANLTNRLIALETGRHEITSDEDRDTKPFNAESVPWNGSWLQISSGKRYKPDTDAVDGWYFTKSSTLREFGGDAFQTNIASYARYLNGFTNKNGKSIWAKDGQIAGVADITNWFDQVGTMPGRKEADKVKSTDANKKETGKSTTTTTESTSSNNDTKDKKETNSVAKDKRWVSETFRKSGLENIKKSLTKGYVKNWAIDGVPNLSADERNVFITRWAKAIENSTDSFTMDVWSQAKTFVRQTWSHAPKEQV